MSDTEPLPAKAGRFGLLLKQPKVVSSLRVSFFLNLSQSYHFYFSLVNLDFWYTLWWFHLSHSHYSPQSILLPTNAVPRIVYSILYIPFVVSWMWFLWYIAPVCLMTKWGGTDTSMWIWSAPTWPAKISTSLLWHTILINSLVRTAIFPVITGFLYFVIHTRWYLISYVQCDDFL